MKEIWKDIEDFKGMYQVSNLGRVKSLERKVSNGKSVRVIKETILKASDNGYGYLRVNLHQNGKQKSFHVHKLVAMGFLNHVPDGTQKIVVDHVNGDKQNNNLNNLQLTTQRHNASKDRKGTSKYTGVHWANQNKKWKSSIRVNGKKKHLGYFNCELEAYQAYQIELNNLK